jgi:hypothetical protein
VALDQIAEQILVDDLGALQARQFISRSSISGLLCGTD